MVEANFSDARSAGYDRQQWQRLKEEALARPLRDRAAAYRYAGGWKLSAEWQHDHCRCTGGAARFAFSSLAGDAAGSKPHCLQVAHSVPLHLSSPPPRSTIRELLAALRDPYTRFISPEDFRGMLK